MSTSARRRANRRLSLRGVVPLATEIPKLILLVALTSAAFVATRALAAHERSQDLSDALAWHNRGRDALARGRREEAIEAFGRASAKNRDDRTYALDLAGALGGADQIDAAARVLEQLRTRIPEDPDVNLQLARIASRRGDVPAAARYYRTAFYAPWPDPRGRLAVRLELSEFLLGQRLAAQALPELIAAATDAPDDPAVRIRIADLLVRAGDPRRALALYQSVLSHDAASLHALAGAGRAAFDLGQYDSAFKYFEAAPDDPAIRERRSLAAIIVRRDPLAARLSAKERRRRAADNLSFVRTRLEMCLASQSPHDTAAVTAALEDVVSAATLPPSADRDVLEDGLALAGRAERTLAAHCGSLDLTDRALSLVADRYAAP
jgi:tetratricopeptide (TPR) repeat protein